MSAECHFNILNRDDPDNSHGLWIGTYGCLILDESPLVGDLIYLSGNTADLSVPADEDGQPPMVRVHGVWRVLSRCWTPASVGSQVWPSGDRQTSPLHLDVMLELAEGIFAASHYNSTQASN